MTPLVCDYKKVGIPLLIICAISLLLFLDATPFNTRGEPREAVVAMSMINDGNWILPVNNGDEIAFKPPLLHWLVAGISTLAGGVSDFTSRLPSALAAIAMVLATFCFFSRRLGTQIALITALLTLTNFEVHRGAMTCRVDMLLAALTVMACYALYTWGERGLRGVPWLGIILCAGAALTKGPVGIVLPCGAVALTLLIGRHEKFLTLLWKFALVAVMSLLPLLLWYWAAYNEPHGGERFLQLIYEENILRFTGQMTYASHINPWPYNVMTMITGFLPYSLILLIVLPLGVKAMRRYDFGSLIERMRMWRPFAMVRCMEPTRLFALVSLFTIFIFYCIPASKRSVYLLPAYPFAALFLAEYLLWLRGRHPRSLHALGITLASLTLIIVAAFVAFRSGAIPEAFLNGRYASENVAFMQALAKSPLGFMEIFLLVIALSAAVSFLSHPRKPRLALLISMVITLFLCLDGVFLPPVMKVKTDRGVARYIQKLQPTGTVYSYRTDVLEANRMHPFTINFYLGDRIIPIDKAHPLPVQGLLVTGNDEITDFLKVFPTYTTELVYDSRHRSCDDRKQIKIYRIINQGRF